MSGAKAQRILIVDDDTAVRALLGRYLQMEGYEVFEAADGGGVSELVDAHEPDLVVLDVMLPQADGLALLTQLRQGSDVPVILLTGRGQEADRVLGLKLGADDYVVKPFSPAEVAARISTVLRRAAPRSTSLMEFGDLSVNVATRETRLRGEAVVLTAKEFDLLAFLASSPRQVFSRGQLLEHVWQSSSSWQSPDTVTEHVRRLRRRIEEDPDSPRWITTVRGAGYRFDP